MAGIPVAPPLLGDAPDVFQPRSSSHALEETDARGETRSIVAPAHAPHRRHRPEGHAHRSGPGDGRWHSRGGAPAGAAGAEHHTAAGIGADARCNSEEHVGEQPRDLPDIYKPST